MTIVTPNPPAARHGAPAGESGLPRLVPPAGRAVRAGAGAGAGAGVPPGLDLVAHQRWHGMVRFRGAELIEEVAAAGLTGRGGAAFPVARKLAAVAAAGPPAVVVGNAAEGEPASSKDAALVWFAP